VSNEIFLSLFSEGDIDRLFQIHSDLQSARMRQAKAVPKSISQVKDWLVSKSATQSPDNFCLAIRQKSNSDLIGYITLKRFEESPTTGEVGIVLQFSKRRGFASQALSLLEKLAKDELGFRIIVANVITENLEANAFFAKNSFNIVDSTPGRNTFQKHI